MSNLKHKKMAPDCFIKVKFHECKDDTNTTVFPQRKNIQTSTTYHRVLKSAFNKPQAQSKIPVILTEYSSAVLKP